MASDDKYSDILYAPRHISKRHAPMAPLSRAAIFAPYAALTGFESQIIAARHHRCNRILLSDERQEAINLTLTSIRKYDTVSVTYFLYNPGSDGKGGFADGEYVDLIGKVLHISPTCKTLRVGSKEHWSDISFEDIWELCKDKS